MPLLGPMRRWRSSLIVAVLLLFVFVGLVRRDPEIIDMDRYRAPLPVPDAPPAKLPAPGEGANTNSEMRLAKQPDRYPVQSLRGLPKGGPGVRPIQARPAPAETAEAREVRHARRAAVLAAFEHSWAGYKEHAWLADEVQPVSGTPRNDLEKLGGWAATLVDTLDTLWIMGLHDEFRMAARACEAIDFGHTDADTVHVFETTIRYLGGFLGAYEISGQAHPGLLRKAEEIGEILLGAFDTPNRLPMGRWDWRAYVRGEMQASAPHAMLAAEIGTLSLEFTKLSQLTGDNRYYDAVQRIEDVLAAHQRRTQLPGMWPVSLDAGKPAFDKDTLFTLNGRADSLFEYLPKQWLLLGGAHEQPRQMYEGFLPVAKKHLFRRVINEWNLRLVLPGEAMVAEDALAGKAVHTIARGEHLGCFVGGMVGLAARAFGGEEDVDLAAQLTDGCVWSYNVTATGVGPEKFYFATCGGVHEPQDGFRCDYTPNKWTDAIKQHERLKHFGQELPDLDADVQRIVDEGRLPVGMAEIDNPHYLLRPEAIESVFVMWRLTGDAAWQDKAWRMFEAVVQHSGALTNRVAAAAIEDVTAPEATHMDRMESFWLAETLKYFYLVFDEFDVLSLDEWVLNTEAHPLKRIPVHD